MMDIAILGAGIDGLLAAHAVTQCGHNVVIYGDEETKWAPRGARSMLLMRDIPYITDSFEQAVQISIIPNEAMPTDLETATNFYERYEHKVYGPEDYAYYSERYVLAELAEMPSFMKAFDVRKAYSALWELYVDHVQYQWITPKWYIKTKVRHDHDMIINTLPMVKWCGEGPREQKHTFPCANFWYTNSAPFGPLHQHIILLDASDASAHYLQANLWGTWIVEWPNDSKPPPVEGLAKDIRPLRTDCTCHSDFDFVNMGQWALWNHALPIHDSYYETIELIDRFANMPKQLDLEF